MALRRVRNGSRYVPTVDATDAILGKGELAIDDQTGDMKIGDGEHRFSELEALPTSSSSENIDGGTP